MATAQVLKVTHTVVAGAGDRVKAVEDYLGRTDIGDALKGMDEATQEEAQMADAEVQNVEHNVDNEGGGVQDKVFSFDDNEASVDDVMSKDVDDKASIIDSIISIDDDDDDDYPKR